MKRLGRQGWTGSSTRCGYCSRSPAPRLVRFTGPGALTVGQSVVLPAQHDLGCHEQSMRVQQRLVVAAAAWLRHVSHTNRCPSFKATSMVKGRMLKAQGLR